MRRMLGLVGLCAIATTRLGGQVSVGAVGGLVSSNWPFATGNELNHPLVGRADSLPDALHAPIRFSVAEAEAEGAQWPALATPTTQRNGVLDDFRTADSRHCATATSIGPLRSGEFVIGGELVPLAPSNDTVKIWWAPMHPDQQYPLVVRGASLTRPGDTLRFVSTNWAVGGPPPYDYAHPNFYASGFPFPAPGRWLVIATSGPDWGCFILTK